MGKEVVAVLGGKGMLGTELVASCARNGYDVRVYDLPGFDITNAEHVGRMVDASDAIINCAAYTDVDGAERHADQARLVNGVALGELGEQARRGGKWVLHFSTDFVFDGALDRPYVETDAPNPINEYGKSKLLGEQLLQESGCSCCLVRLEWMYGPNGTNFVTKLVERARTGGTLTVVEDQVGSPTATTEAAAAVRRLLEKRAEGLFHFASTGYVSRYDMAAFIVDHMALDVELRPCRTCEYPAPATRPLNSRFDCRKVQSLLGGGAAPWQEPLARFLRQL